LTDLQAAKWIKELVDEDGKPRAESDAVFPTGESAACKTYEGRASYSDLSAEPSTGGGSALPGLGTLVIRHSFCSRKVSHLASRKVGSVQAHEIKEVAFPTSEPAGVLGAEAREAPTSSEAPDGGAEAAVAARPGDAGVPASGEGLPGKGLQGSGSPGGKGLLGGAKGRSKGPGMPLVPSLAEGRDGAGASPGVGGPKRGGLAAGGTQEASRAAGTAVEVPGPGGDSGSSKGKLAKGPGKGPPLPLGKGKGSLAPGKVPPPAGKRTERGHAGAKGGESKPTREDILSWTDRKKNPLRWKRVVQEDGTLDESLFAGDDQGLKVEVNDDTLAAFCTKADAAAKKVVFEVKKEVLWEPDETKTPAKRRQMIAIQLKAWSRSSAQVFREHLAKLDFDAIRHNPDFRVDRVQALSDLVEQTKRTEWERLKERGAPMRYVWDKDVEGFFLELEAVPRFRQRLWALNLGLLVERDLDALEQECEVLNRGMSEVLRSAALKSVFRKILCIGNRLNAGEARLSRADGFDVVALLEETDFLRLYRGDKMNLLEYLQENELSGEDQKELGSLARHLKDITWKPPAQQEGGSDPTDLGEMRKRSNEVARALGTLGVDLEEALAQLRALPPAPTLPGPEGVGAEADAAAEARQRESQWLREHSGLLEVHKRRSIKVDTSLDAVEETLRRLHRFLVHQPPKKKELVVGRSLGAVAHFVRLLGASRKRSGALPRASQTRAKGPYSTHG